MFRFRVWRFDTRLKLKKTYNLFAVINIMESYLTTLWSPNMLRGEFYFFKVFSYIVLGVILPLKFLSIPRRVTTLHEFS